MAVTISSPNHFQFHISKPQNINFNSQNHQSKKKRRPLTIVTNLKGNLNPKPPEEEEEVKDIGVKAALSMLKFYKREISPLMPNSCRYVPTCSEYSMIAYKRYGVLKGTVLTTWRLCRCNPLGGSGFDPPRWFDEGSPPDQ